MIQPVAVVLAPVPSILKVVNPPVNLTILPVPSRPISTDSAVDVVNIVPLALTAGAITRCPKVFKVGANVNRVAPTESTNVWFPTGAAYEVAVILLTVISEEEFNVDCLLVNKSSACSFVYTF